MRTKSKGLCREMFHLYVFLLKKTPPEPRIHAFQTDFKV